MTEREIIELYFARSEEAVSETRRSFGALMRSIASGILPDRRDAEEAVSDACLAAWNTIPPERPRSLAAYLSRLTRSASIDAARRSRRKKRGGGEYDAVLDEVSELASREEGPEAAAESALFRETVERFLRGLGSRKRAVFVQRYWYMLPIKQIASEQGMTEAAVKMELSRTRAELRKLLGKEGFYDEK